MVENENPSAAMGGTNDASGAGNASDTASATAATGGGASDAGQAADAGGAGATGGGIEGGGTEGEAATAETAPPAAPEEITYHAVEKDGHVTAIWEMQGRKHLRTIDPRSRQGEKILSLYTAEHPDDEGAQQQSGATDNVTA